MGTIATDTLDWNHVNEMPSPDVVLSNASDVPSAPLLDKQPMITLTLLYLILNILVHLLFVFTTVFDNAWPTVRAWTRSYYYSFFGTLREDGDSTSSLNLQQPCTTKKTLFSSTSSSSLLSRVVPEFETVLARTIRSFGLFLCGGVLLTNWLCLGIYLLPTFYPNAIQFPSTSCRAQSFLLHVFTLFHLHLTIGIRLLWYVCFTFDHYWQTITYRRLVMVFSGILLFLCIFTWPSVSDEWASIQLDHVLRICVVSYTFRWSYTVFVLSFACFIPLIALLLSHYRQTKSIQRRIEKYSNALQLDRRQEQLIVDRKNVFQCVSSIVLLWTFLSVVLLICIHVPAAHERTIKFVVYQVQLCAFLFEPILYVFVFRSVSIITLLRPTPTEM